MSYIVTVKKSDRVTPASANASPIEEQEIYRQTLEDFNLSKFVIALNKQPRVRKPKAVKP
jgi:hypothetical protein